MGALLVNDAVLGISLRSPLRWSLDDGCRLPTFLETQLLDSFISDGARNAYAAFVFDGHVAVNGAILYGNNSALDLIASGNVWDLFVANMTLVALITA